MDNIELLKCYSETRSVAIRNRIVEQNLGLVRKVAHRISVTRGIDFDEIFQQGCIGLLKAVERFQHSQGCTLSSFAVPYINGEILHYLRDKTDLVKTPRQDKEDYCSVNLTMRRMAELGAPITLHDALKACGISNERWNEILITTKRQQFKELDENIATYEPTLETGGIAALSSNQYLALKFKFLENWDDRKISARLGIPESEVNCLIVSGIEKLEQLHG